VSDTKARKNKRPTFSGQPFIFSASARHCLYGDYVLGLRAFLALSHCELNTLAFGQSLESSALNGAVVNKNVRAATTLNEAETFGFVEELYFASYCIRHGISFPLIDKIACYAQATSADKGGRP